MDCSMPGSSVLYYLQEDRIRPNSHPLSQWCDPTISSSAIPFSSCPQSFPASGSFPVSQLFSSGGQSTGPSASASVLPLNTHGWYLLWLTDLISLQSKRFSRVFSSTIIWKRQFSGAQPFLWSSSHICTTGKTMALTMWTLSTKWFLSLLLNTLCRFVIAFLPRSRHLLISWLRSVSAVIFGY